MKNKGFSLVELIVVIAIMAILVGVAVPVYTSYIGKAQKNKDIQMVDEIKHAMEIAAIGDKWYESLTEEKKTGIGVIVIKANGTTVAPTTNESVVDLSALIDDAMEDTFGTSYLTDLSLSYDDWNGTLANGNATYVVNSSYYGKTDALIGQVQGLTNTLKEYIGTTGAVGGDFGDTLLQLGVTDQTDAQKVANAAVLYVAEKSQEIDSTKFEGLWAQNSGSFISDATGSKTVFSNVFPALAAEYAKIVARVNYSGSEALQALLDPSELNGANQNEVLAKFSARLEAITNALNDSSIVSAEEKARYNEYLTTQAANDAKAYLALLGQVDNAKDLVSSNLSSEEMYKDPSLLSYVNSYLSAAELINDAGAADGDVVIVVALDASGAVRVDCYPMDY